MSIRVRYHPMELTTGAVFETFTQADSYFIHEDNTLELRASLPNNKYRKVAHIHPARWDSVKILEKTLP